MSKWVWVAAAVCLALALTYTLVEGTRFQVPRREVLVKEVDNGYVILCRTTNNPYAYRESVALDHLLAATYARDCLKAPIPPPQWGK